MLFDLDGTQYAVLSTQEERSELTSLHGLLRIMERTGFHEEKALRLVHLARERGRTAQELPRRYQRDYVQDHTRLLYDGYTRPVVYQNFLFIFSSTGRLITAYALPDDFYKIRQYSESGEPVRKFRQYQRMCCA